MVHHIGSKSPRSQLRLFGSMKNDTIGFCWKRLTSLERILSSWGVLYSSPSSTVREVVSNKCRRFLIRASASCSSDCCFSNRSVGKGWVPTAEPEGAADDG